MKRELHVSTAVSLPQCLIKMMLCKPQGQCECCREEKDFASVRNQIATGRQQVHYWIFSLQQNVLLATVYCCGYGRVIRNIKWVQRLQAQLLPERDGQRSGCSEFTEHVTEHIPLWVLDSLPAATFMRHSNMQNSYLSLSRGNTTLNAFDVFKQ